MHAERAQMQWYILFHTDCATKFLDNMIKLLTFLAVLCFPHVMTMAMVPENTHHDLPDVSRISPETWKIFTLCPSCIWTWMGAKVRVKM